MSGHLQRMAAGAARPERGVRPLVGSRFAKDESVGQASVLGMEQELFEESSVVRAPRRVEAASTPRIGATERENRGREEEREERSPLIKKQAERLVGREELAVKEKAEVHGVIPAYTEKNSERLIDTLEAVRPIAAHPLLVQQTMVREQSDQLAMEREEADEHESAERLVIQPIVERSAVERMPMVREPQRESRRGSEEIQIHIGRIEVIAVPAAQQRPSAPAIGRSVESLDEYLRRKDRRAR